MAGGRIGLLGLMGTLLLFSVMGWELIENPTDLLKFYEEEQWGRVSLPDDGSDDTDDADPDAKTSDVDPSAHSGTEDGVTLDSTGKLAGNTDQNSAWMNVVCTDDGFQVSLLSGSLKDVQIVGSEESLSVMNAPDFCSFEVNTLQNTFTVPFTGCNVKHTLNHYKMKLSYVDKSGKKQASASCKQSPPADLIPSPCSNGTNGPGCMPDTPTSPRSSHSQSSSPQAQKCALPPEEQVTCGSRRTSRSKCRAMGCCVCSLTSSCYYPLDSCTADKHFIFAIRHNSVSIPVDPTKLVVPGFPKCRPVIVNANVAIFKFNMTDCGTHVFQVGEMTIYLTEVQTLVPVLELKYGIITRNEPLRFIVECRHSKSGTAPPARVSASYMVMTPSSNLPSRISSDGYYGVQLKIAKDKTYSNYYPHHYQPLHMLLGKPVYLELQLKSTQRDAVLLVNYCVAYPRSAKNALVLIYEGCANPYDENVSILKAAHLPNNRFQRRFRVDSFMFMDLKTNRYLNEEICFMCSTEVCRPSEKQCEQQCFDGKEHMEFAPETELTGQ